MWILAAVAAAERPTYVQFRSQIRRRIESRWRPACFYALQYLQHDKQGRLENRWEFLLVRRTANCFLNRNSATIWRKQCVVFVSECQCLIRKPITIEIGTIKRLMCAICRYNFIMHCVSRIPTRMPPETLIYESIRHGTDSWRVAYNNDRLRQHLAMFVSKMFWFTDHSIGSRHSTND